MAPPSLLPPPPFPPDFAGRAQKIINDASTGLRVAMWEQITAHRAVRPPVSPQKILLLAVVEHARRLLADTQAILDADPEGSRLDDPELDPISVN